MRKPGHGMIRRRNNGGLNRRNLKIYTAYPLLAEKSNDENFVSTRKSHGWMLGLMLIRRSLGFGWTTKETF